MINGHREGEIDTNGEVVSIDVSGAGAVGIQLAGTFIGTITFQGSINGGDPVSLDLIPSTGTTPASTGTTAGCWSGKCGGYTTVHARATAWTSGTARVALHTAGDGGR